MIVKLDGRQSSCRPVVLAMDGWSYLAVLPAGANRPSASENNLMEQYIKITKRNICEMYMRNCPTWERQADEMRIQRMDEANREFYARKMKHYADRVFNKYYDPRKLLCWKMQSDTHSMFISISSMDNLMGQKYILDVFDFNSETSLVSVFSYCRSSGMDDDRWTSTGIPIIYHSVRQMKNQLYMEKLSQTSAMGPRVPTAEIPRLIYEGLKWIYETPPSQHVVNIHNDFEIRMFSDFIAMTTQNDQICVNILSYTNGDFFNTPIEDKIKELDGGENSPCLPEWFFSNKQEYPLVDLNEKEWNFVNTYLTRKEIFTNPDANYNLLDAIRHTRYGIDFRFEFDDPDNPGSCYPVSAHGELYLEHDLFRTMYIWEPNRHIRSLAIVDFADVSSFHAGRSTVSIRSDVFMDTSVLDFPRSRDEIRNLIPSLFVSNENIMAMATTYLGMLVILHDRPERTRMIKETTKNNTNVSKPKNPKSTHQPETDYVIKRILKSTREAKEYVARMSESGHADREYVIEEWTRIGHYRRLKSGKVIWIDETTCKRHLPMSNKEIHIRL